MATVPQPTRWRLQHSSASPRGILGTENSAGPAAMSSIGGPMSKRGRKKKSRKKNGANHGNRPNS
jgi:hypothetical protein